MVEPIALTDKSSLGEVPTILYSIYIVLFIILHLDNHPIILGGKVNTSEHFQTVNKADGRIFRHPLQGKITDVSHTLNYL